MIPRTLAIFALLLSACQTTASRKDRLSSLYFEKIDYSSGCHPTVGPNRMPQYSWINCQAETSRGFLEIWVTEDDVGTAFRFIDGAGQAPLNCNFSQTFRPEEWPLGIYRGKIRPSAGAPGGSLTIFQALPGGGTPTYRGTFSYDSYENQAVLCTFNVGSSQKSARKR